MLDPHGYLRHCFTLLVAWTADLPEQQMLTCVSKSASPVMEATHKQFSDAHRHLPCAGKLTLERISQALEKADPWNLPRFLKFVKALYLSSIHFPFWRNW